jgi:DNA-binding MarR family transcriptional regulator
LVEGPKSIGALAEPMGVTQQAVWKTVAELEGLGYVERRRRVRAPR